jgi:hypothetical protein
MTHDYRGSDRPKTNSITHLVKIVAEEVVTAALEKRGAPIDKTSIECAILENVSDHIQPIKNVLKLVNIRLGRLERVLGALSALDPQPDIDATPEDWEKAYHRAPWGQAEEGELSEQFNKAVKWMASQHGRTEVAIRCRLSEMIHSGRLRVKG